MLLALEELETEIRIAVQPEGEQKLWQHSGP